MKRFQMIKAAFIVVAFGGAIASKANSAAVTHYTIAGGTCTTEAKPSACSTSGNHNCTVVTALGSIKTYYQPTTNGTCVNVYRKTV